MEDWDVQYIEKIERAEHTKSFRFERPNDFEYLPGQFFIIAIPKEGNEKLIHHFTLSSSPTETFLEFTTRMRDSEFKNRMDEMPYGATVNIRAAQGVFTLNDGMNKVAYICGGIGITTARSVIRWATDTNSEIDIVLLYANRNLAGAAFREEFDILQNERVRVVHVLSKPDGDWAGPSGHVDADTIRSLLSDWKDRHFFVSGPPAMVNAIRSMLSEEVGVSSDRIKVENYTGY